MDPTEIYEAPNLAPQTMPPCFEVESRFPCISQKLSTLTPRKGCVLTLNLGRVYDLVGQPKVDRVMWHTSQAGPYRKPLVPMYLYSECKSYASALS